MVNECGWSVDVDVGRRRVDGEERRRKYDGKGEEWASICPDYILFLRPNPAPNDPSTTTKVKQTTTLFSPAIVNGPWVDNH